MDVYTRQDIKILDILEEKNRYIAQKKYVLNRLDKEGDIYLNFYDWLTKEASKIIKKPEDVEIPIWVSLEKDKKLSLIENTVILSLDIPDDKIILIDMHKWGQITNYSYLPINIEDKNEHLQILDEYGINNQKAIMTNFYPQIKNKIMDSWTRLFDNNIKSIDINGKEIEPLFVGIIWEVRKEWIIDYQSIHHNEHK